MNRRPILLVGHSPNAAGDPPLCPLKPTTAGGRLFKMSGWPMSDWEAYCERMNTLPEGFEEMTLAQQRLRAATLYSGPDFFNRVIVFVGRGTADLYRWTMPAWGSFVYNRSMGSNMAWIPHTSGLSRCWNDPDDRRKLHDFFQNLHRTVKSGDRQRAR